MRSRVSFVILMLVVLPGYQFVSSQKTSSSRTTSFNGYEPVDETGNIRKPADYWGHYEILGTWVVLDPNGNQMHFTYASLGAAEYFRNNGKFADGTVLVKEIDKTDHARLTTGDAHWATDFVEMT